jgi:hypothetical protein
MPDCPVELVQGAPCALVQLIDPDVDGTETKSRAGRDRGTDKGAVYLNNMRLEHLCLLPEPGWPNSSSIIDAPIQHDWQRQQHTTIVVPA